MRTKEECLKEEVKKSLNIDINSRHWFVYWWMLLDPEPSLNTFLRAMEAYASQFSGSEPEGKEAVEFAEVFKALADLVYLKDYKDAMGKTPEYLEQQPKFWETAKQIVERYKNKIWKAEAK